MCTKGVKWKVLPWRPPVITSAAERPSPPAPPGLGSPAGRLIEIELILCELHL